MVLAGIIQKNRLGFNSILIVPLLFFSRTFFYFYIHPCKEAPLTNPDNCDHIVPIHWWLQLIFYVAISPYITSFLLLTLLLILPLQQSYTVSYLRLLHQCLKGIKNYGRKWRCCIEVLFTKRQQFKILHNVIFYCYGCSDNKRVLYCLNFEQ